MLEATALDPAAEQALWEWLVGIDLVTQVKAWRTPPVHNPLLLQVVEPQRLGLTIRDGIWLRLVDVRAALEARTYAVSLGLTLEVTDAFLPANAGRWTVGRAGRPGRGAVTAAGTASPPTSCSTSPTSRTVYLGAFKFADLVAGRVRRVPRRRGRGADAPVRRRPRCLGPRRCSEVRGPREFVISSIDDQDRSC